MDMSKGPPRQDRKANKEGSGKDPPAPAGNTAYGRTRQARDKARLHHAPPEKRSGGSLHEGHDEASGNKKIPAPPGTSINGNSEHETSRSDTLWEISSRTPQ